MAEPADNPITPTGLLGHMGSADVGTVTPAATRALLNVADGATANAADAQLRDRATHTGTQATSTVAGLDSSLASLAPLTSPGFSGVPTAPTAAADTNSTQLATTAYVQGELVDRAPLASPALTGTPTAPTPAGSDSSTRLATTAMVQAALSTVTSGLEYLGTWNAATNTPTLSNSSGVSNPGGFYIVSVAGTTSLNGIATWGVGDWVISDDVGWKKIVQTDAVASVFGRTGVVAAVAGDYNTDQITETLSNKILTAAERTKLAGIAAGATVNSTDAQLRDRTTHTGAQTIATVTGLQTALDAKAALASPVLTGVPTAPTAGAGTNTTQLSTTAFVQAAIAGSGGGGGGPANTVVNQGTPNTALSATEAQVGAVSITPSGTAARILVATTLYATKDSPTAARTLTMRLRRGTTNTDPQIGGSVVTRSQNVASVIYGPLSLTYIDTPGVTSPVTYSVRALIDAGASNATAFDLVAMEISGGGGGGGLNIPALAEDLTPDATADFAASSDTSAAGANKKVLWDNLRFSAANAAASSLQRTVKSKAGERISIKDFGAVCDNSTDDTAAWAAAITYLRSRGLSNASQDRPILWVPANSKFDPSGIVWDYPMHIILEGNTFITKPWVITGQINISGLGCEGGSIQQSRGPIAIIYGSGSGPWTPSNALVQLRYLGTVHFENIGITGVAGGAALHIGEATGTTPIINCSAKYFRNCAFQSANAANSKAVTIENAFWIYFYDSSFVGYTAGKASLWVTDAAGSVAFVNNTGLLLLQNCNIAGRGIHIGTSGAAATTGYHYWFDEIHFENANEAFLTFENANDGRANIRLSRCNFADFAATPPYHLVDNTAGATLQGVHVPDFHTGFTEVGFWTGRYPKDGIQLGHLWQGYEFGNATYDVVDRFPIMHEAWVSGRHEAIDAWSGRDFAPQVVPANALTLTLTSPHTTAYFSNNSFGITVTGGQLAPDGSTSAISFQNTQGTNGSVGHWEAGFGNITDHWVIMGCWFRNANQANPVLFDPTTYLLRIQSQNGSGVTVDGVSTTNVELKFDWVAQNKSIGWHFAFCAARVQASSAISSWQTFINIGANNTILLWNLFAFALPVASYSKRDISALMSKLAVCNSVAKPGVLAQLPHQTFATGSGATGARPSAATVGAGAQWFDTTLNRPIWSNGTAMCLPEVGRIEDIQIQIETVANKTYHLDKAVFPYTINSLWRDVKTSGSCTLAVQINGTNVTSLSGLSATTTEAEATATGANSVAIGDEVTLVASANSSALDLVARLKYTVLP